MTDGIQPPFGALLTFDISGAPCFFLLFARSVGSVELFLPMVVINALDLVE
jgi:hypothetical protein